MDGPLEDLEEKLEEVPGDTGGLRRYLIGGSTVGVGGGCTDGVTGG